MAINKKLFIKSAAGGVTPSENFNVVEYTGNGTTTKEVSVGFTPDWVWVKSLVDDSHYLVDSVRGDGVFLFSNSNVANDFNSAHLKLITNGFDAMSNPNVSSREYISWSWKGGGAAVTNPNGTTSSTISLNSDAGFSIVKTSSAGGTINVGHGLGSDISMIILKGADTAEAWQVWHKDLGTGKYLQLSSTAQATTRANSFSTVNSTIFENNWTSGSVEWIVYSFAEISGYSKFGTYNGSSSEHTVDFGFAPAFVMIKRTDTSGGWRMFDYKRDSGTGERRVDHSLQAQSTGAQFDSSGTTNGEYLRFTDTGLKFPTYATNQDVNNSSGTYIYMAFARD